MKDSIAYSATFLFAFILVTSGMFIVNEKYNNIFRLDFSARVDSSLVKKDSLKIADSLAKIRQDSLLKAQKTDSLKSNEKTETAEALKNEHNNSQMAEKPTAKKDKFADSAYVNWRKQTLKLYESLDSKQVAKVIVNHPEDVARDLIYNMKKKKAGEVLSLLSPDMVTKLTKVQ